MSFPTALSSEYHAGIHISELNQTPQFVDMYTDMFNKSVTQASAEVQPLLLFQESHANWRWGVRERQSN
jgi:hypothetical protein